MNVALQIVILLVVGLFPCGLIAGEFTPRFGSRMWQAEDGLPRNSVSAICQTADGFLWVGTAGGLARFDGVEFDSFPIEVAPEKFPSVTALCGTKEGALWVGTGNEGLFFFRDGQWFAKNSAGLSNTAITCIRQARDGIVWVGTQQGLWRYDRQRLFRSEEHPPTTTNYIRSLFEDREGRMWVSYSSGLVCFAEGQVHANYPAEHFPDLLRTAIVDSRGTLWVGTRNGLSRQRNIVTTFYKRDGLPDNIVSALHEDGRGILWIGTYGGVARRVGAELVTETTSRGDAFDQVFCFHEDHEGNVWAGTKEGLYRFSPQYCDAITRRHGMAHNNVISVLPSAAADVWVGTWGGGLHELHNGRVAGHHNRASSREMRNDLVLALCERRGGGLWFGTDFNGGLYELIPNGSRWKCHRFDTADGPPMRAIRAIAYDADDQLWVGTSGGLFRFNGKRLVEANVAPGLKSIAVRCFLAGRDGAFWIGTEEGLVCWREKRTNVFTTAQGLSHNLVLSLHEDDEGALWVGTGGGGLNRVLGGAFVEHPANALAGRAFAPHVRSFTTGDGLHSNTILEIIETADGFLWMSSYHGIFRLRKSDLNNYRAGKTAPLHCLTFGQDDGMESSVCVGAAKPAGCIGSDGRLWFPTTKGVVAVNTNIPLNEEAPPVVIRGVIADRKTIGPPGGKQTLEIPPGRGELEFHYSALSFQAPTKNRYKYMLEGVDRDWVEATTQRRASYHNLEPGRYRFRVIACNNHGVWNTIGASSDVRLLPHFWQTWLFKAGIAGIFGLVLFGMDRVRVGRLRTVEQLRLRIAADLHDEVGSNLGSISLLARLLRKSKTLTADEQKDVALIELVTAQTANAVKDIVWFTNPNCDTMQDMSMRMKDTAETMLIGMECYFESRIENMDAPLSVEFRKNVFLIFKETLANVVKHSQSSCVEIIVVESGHLLKLTVRDNGVGFDPGAPSRGNGLKNLRRRAEQIGATFELSRDSNGGTLASLTGKLR